MEIAHARAQCRTYISDVPDDKGVVALVEKLLNPGVPFDAELLRRSQPPWGKPLTRLILIWEIAPRMSFEIEDGRIGSGHQILAHRSYRSLLEIEDF